MLTSFSQVNPLKQTLSQGARQTTCINHCIQRPKEHQHQHQLQLKQRQRQQFKVKGESSINTTANIQSNEAD